MKLGFGIGVMEQCTSVSSKSSASVMRWLLVLVGSGGMRCGGREERGGRFLMKRNGSNSSSSGGGGWVVEGVGVV